MNAHFHQALEDLKKMLFEVSAQAENSVHAAIGAFEMETGEAAAAVIGNDAKIDAMEIRIEEECLKILALYQPVASDLRTVVTVLKVNGEMERIGDLAVNIAERAGDSGHFRNSGIEKIDFHDMVKRSCEMLKNSLDAFAYHDSALAAGVIAADDAVDALHRGNYALARDGILRHPAEAQYFLDCLTVSRCLERIADIATNIAEDVIYLESGRIVRHRHEGENHVQ